MAASHGSSTSASCVLAWQGVDKIIELAEARPSWSFDLIGVKDLAVSTNVTCHGFLALDGYADVLAGADVALGTLALHRKQMQEASPLKVRRYLEFGLPLILGYADTDLAGLDPWWLLTLPNVETNVRDSLVEIDRFVASVAGKRVHRRRGEAADLGRGEGDPPPGVLRVDRLARGQERRVQVEMRGPPARQRELVLGALPSGRPEASPQLHVLDEAPERFGQRLRL